MKEEDKERGWISAEVKCPLCGFEWLAVYHINCDRLECDQCKNMVEFEIITQHS